MNAVAKTRPFRALGVAAALLALVVAAGCGKESSGQPPAGGGMPAPLVVARTVKRADIPLSFEYMGQTAGSREVEVRARVGGILLRRAYEEGRRVRQGDLMFEIDPAPFQAALDQAKGALGQSEAKLAKAKREMDRMQNLFKGDVVSQKDRDDAVTDFQTSTAEVEAARARVKEAQINLGYTKVTAPIGGITSKEARSEGSLVVAGTDSSLLTTMTRLDPLYVHFSLPGPDYTRMRTLRAENKMVYDGEDLAVSITLPDGKPYAKPGRINFTDTTVDPATGVVKIRAEFPNTEADVLPGQYVRVRLSGMRLVAALAVPQGAVLQTQMGTLVWVLDQNNVVQPRPVTLGEQIGNTYLVEKGLEDGERIIVEGVIKVRPGVTVNVKPEGDAAPQGAGQAPAQGQASAKPDAAKPDAAKAEGGK